MITAVVRPFKLDELRHAIAQLGVQGVTITEVQETKYGPRAKVEIAVDDAICEPVLEAIAEYEAAMRQYGYAAVASSLRAMKQATGEKGPAFGLTKTALRVMNAVPVLRRRAMTA